MRTAVRSAALIAFSVACGYAKLILFPYLFFVELFSVAVFLSGVIVGTAWGVWVGAAARLLFSIANPYGPPHPWVLAAQVVGAALIGALGGLARRALAGPLREAPAARAAFLGACGLLGTVGYDLLTNLAQGLVFGAPRTTLAIAVIPSLQHIASNTAIFAVIGGLAVSWLRRDPRLLSHAATLAIVMAIGVPTIGAPALVTAAQRSDTPSAARQGADSTSTPSQRPDTTAAPPRVETITRPIPLVDSTSAPGTVPARPDSTLVLPSLVRNLPGGTVRPLPLPDTLGLVIRADAERKRGDLTLTQLLEGRRPVWTEGAPGFAPRFGAPRLLDTGTPVAPDPSPAIADRATDRTLLADFTHLSPGTPYALGAPALATAWSGPETQGLDAFDYVAIDSSLAPAPFRSAGQLLARPQAVSFTALAMPDPPAPYRVRSTLLYRKGAGDLLDTAARFSSPLFAHGIAGSYARHAADGERPFLGSLSTRYALAAGITRGGALRSWVEGRLFKMRMELDHPDEDEGGFFARPFNPARAEWAGREGVLHALWTGGDLVASTSLRAAKTQATQIGYENIGRERWTFRELGAEARLASSDSLSWGWSLEASGSRRRIELRSDAVSLQPLIRTGRIAAGLRNRDGAGGVSADAAFDAREGDRPFVDGRLSFWRARDRARVRLDVESAHERPSFVDLLSPSRIDTMTAFDGPALVLAQGGNPRLGTRALQGALGAFSWRASRGVELRAFGSARHLTDDFGWDVTRATAGDTIFVTDAARERGDGWVFQGAAGADAAFGFVTLRGLAWVRGGTAGLSRRAGSPPRAGADASLGLRGTFFQGDLPLELELLAHLTGARSGVFAAPAAAICDARLHADFGSAGIFATISNVFDGTVPSAVYWIDRNEGAALPRRSFSAGVVWNIFD